MHNNPLSCDLERLKVSDTQGQHISEWTCCVIVNTSSKENKQPINDVHYNSHKHSIGFVFLISVQRGQSPQHNVAWLQIGSTKLPESDILKPKSVHKRKPQAVLHQIRVQKKLRKQFSLTEPIIFQCIQLHSTINNKQIQVHQMDHSKQTQYFIHSSSNSKIIK